MIFENRACGVYACGALAFCLSQWSFSFDE